MTDLRLPLRPELAGLSPYGAPQLDVPVRLNVNENPWAPSDELVDDIACSVARAASGLNRYPDRDFLELRGELARYLADESGVSVPPEHVWAANGSNEVMTQILQAFAGTSRTVVSCAPTYSMYHEYARDTCSRWVTCDRHEDFSIDLDALRDLLETEHPAVVLLASPNNPTGTALSLDDIRSLADDTRFSGPVGPDGQPTASLLVIDEAYAEFRRAGTSSALELVEHYPHVVVSRTMSKAFGMAGLRLGYMVACQDVIDAIMLVRLPYHLSAITQAAALAALRHRESLMQQVADLRDSRDALAHWLESRGLQVAQSDANFIFFGRFDNRQDIFDKLLERGVLIRVVGPDGWLRVSVGTPEENQQFMTALEEVLS